MLFLGLIDLQDTVVGRKARNTGHKALRPRGDRSRRNHRLGPGSRRLLHLRAGHGRGSVYYYSLYDARAWTVSAEFPDSGRGSSDEHHAAHAGRGRGDVQSSWRRTRNDLEPYRHLRNGKSLTSLGDTTRSARPS